MEQLFPEFPVKTTSSQGVLSIQPKILELLKWQIALTIIVLGKFMKNPKKSWISTIWTISTKHPGNFKQKSNGTVISGKMLFNLPLIQKFKVAFFFVVWGYLPQLSKISYQKFLFLLILLLKFSAAWFAFQKSSSYQTF